jgi:hypothetical protein
MAAAVRGPRRREFVVEREALVFVHLPDEAKRVRRRRAASGAGGSSIRMRSFCGCTLFRRSRGKLAHDGIER